MNALLVALSLALCVTVGLFLEGGAAALLLCGVVAAAVAAAGTAVVDEDQRGYLLKVFAGALIVRVFIGSVIYGFNLQEFFGGDAFAYDEMGRAMLSTWVNNQRNDELINSWLGGGTGWGMAYLVGSIYYVFGRNMLATQLFNAVLGAATAPLVFLCARHIFQNLRVAKIAALAVAFYPSLVLWSSQGLKDGPIVFLLALAMLATLKLGEKISPTYLVLLVASMLGLLTLRFYIFYMLAAAVAGAFVIGMRRVTGRSLARQFVVVVFMGVALTYLGVLRTAGQQLDKFGNLQAIQTSRADLAASANSGFGKDVDVSTTSGAVAAIPVGMLYLLFAPFPWQLASLRQSITLPEMLAWWASFPLLVMGIWFTIKYRLRQALPILIFTTMLTLAYSIFQGNVGTAYRQRSQLLVFYFIFVAVGAVLFREQQEERARNRLLERRTRLEAARAMQAARRYGRWKAERERELEEMARDISGRINF